MSSDRDIFEQVLAAIAGIKADLDSVRAEVNGLRGEVNGLRAEMHSEISGLRAEMRAEFAKVHEELGEIRSIQDAHGKEMLALGDGVRAIHHKLTRVGEILVA